MAVSSKGHREVGRLLKPWQPRLALGLGRGGVQWQGPEFWPGAPERSPEVWAQVPSH